MTLLQQRDLDRKRRRLAVYAEVRQQLRLVLGELMPGAKVILFGSITREGVFNDRSDIDLAFEQLPTGFDAWSLGSVLMERLQRPVDVVMLGECRFREKILREGETWTL